MNTVDQKYLTSIESIKSGIQNSDLLATYLDTEEEEDYLALKNYFEPQISELHEKVAAENPLQLVNFERKLFNEGFEGLYLPRILGYSVLRGEINERIKYIRPQDHFKDIIVTICNSLNFDQLKNRIGQTMQVGFGLSSDIWISNLKGLFSNKKIVAFLDSQRLPKYRDAKNRLTGLVKFRKQFESLNYHTTDFAENITELKLKAPSMKSFLIYRSVKEFDNSQLIEPIKKLVSDPNLMHAPEFVELLTVAGLYYDLDAEGKEQYQSSLNKLREEEGFGEKFFGFYNNLLEDKNGLTAEMDKRMSSNVSRTQSDELSAYFNVLDAIHSKGYIHEEAIEAVRGFYDSHEGLSVYNECLRNHLKNYFETFLGNIDEESYQEYFEINKTFTTYMDIFSNQEFNQDIKAMSLKYVKRLKKRYTDKRGKDYQDIKKFVKTTFIDLGFMKEKEIVELFKTRRKPKA
jgi:hypothetical protein